MGVEGGAPPPREPPEPLDRPPPGEDRPADGDGPALLGLRARVIVGIFFFALYAGSFAARGKVVAGLVGGVLGGVLMFLILKEADERRKRRHRRG